MNAESSNEQANPKGARRRRDRHSGKELQAFLERPDAVRAFARLEGGRRIPVGAVCRLVTGVERPQVKLPENLTDETYAMVLFGEHGEIRRQMKRFVLPANSHQASTEFDVAFDHAGRYTVLVDILYGIDFVCQLAIKIRVDVGKRISQSA